MASFEICIQEVLAREGAWSDHPDDPGGATAWGISEPLSAAYGYEPMMVTHEIALRIYREEFWNPLRCSEIANNAVAFELLDTAVNIGRRRAVLILQRACRLLGDHDLKADRVIGVKTISSTNQWVSSGYTTHLVAAMNGFQFDHYVELYHHDPDRWGSFIRGWMMRCLPYWPMEGDSESKRA